MNERRIFRLNPKMELAFWQRRNLDAGESLFAYPKILSCMTRTGLGPVRENLSYRLRTFGR
jgi:hypothetical protein